MVLFRYIIALFLLPSVAFAQDADSVLFELKEDYTSGDAQHFLQSIRSWPDLSNTERLHYSRKLESIIAREGTPADDMMASQTLGILYNRLSLFDSALVCFNDALEIAYDINDSVKMAHLLTNISSTHYYQGQLDQALSKCIDSQVIAEKIGDTLRIIINLNIQGSILNMQGNFESATECYLKALKILKDQDDPLQEAQMLANLAVIMGKTGDYQTAIRYTRESIPHYVRANELYGLSNSLSNMGLLYQKLNILDSAEYYYDSSLHVGIRANNMLNIVSGYINTGKILADRGQYNKALDYFNQGIALTEENEMLYENAILIADKAYALMMLERYGEAELFFKQAIKVAKESGFREMILQNYKNLALLYERKGKMGQAYHYLNLYNLLNDSLLNESNQQAVAEMQTRFETEKKEQEIILLTKDLEIRSLALNKKQNQLFFLIGGIAALLVVIIMAFLIYRLRQQKYRVLLEKKNLEVEQQLFRSQMNPHFIFNSLNSIQSYISASDDFKAMTYLAKFAELMRMILDNSRRQTIPLDEEIRTLELYLELERLRFRGMFEFNIHVDLELPSDKIFLPPMLVQPLVENAIKHGFRGLDRKGLLEVSFTKENGAIHCTVQDNGIGLEAAEKRSQKEHINRESLGLRLTMDRLKILRTAPGSEANLSVSELKDEDGNPLGTKVELNIPYEEE
jgi:tetratricopeptide (TPR) repeat protein/anti-sigma regulatory factor (Ser/Thr protein kinase)